MLVVCLVRIVVLRLFRWLFTRSSALFGFGVFWVACVAGVTLRLWFVC